MKTKIIQIHSASSSCSTKDYEEDIYNTAWNVQITNQIKKFLPNAEIECWAIEKEYEEEREKIYDGIKFRIFPANISIRHSMEISMPMINALIREQNNAKKENKRLIVHIHEHHTWQSYLILLFLKKNNVRIISQHHGAKNAFKNLKKYKKLILVLPFLILMEFLEKLLFKRIDVFYGGTPEEIDYLKKIAPNSLIRLQTMGIEEKYFKEINKVYARKKLGLRINKKYFIFLGRIKTTKGIGELLTAMKKIKQNNVELL